MEGLGMVVFNNELQIEHAIGFTMQDYPLLKESLRQRLE